MQKIYGKLQEADILVVASPVYFYGISAQLKTLVDRLHTPLRNTFHIRKMALLLVAGATLPTVFDSIKIQYRLILDYFKLEDGGSVLAGGVRELGEIEKSGVMEEAFRLGKEIE